MGGPFFIETICAVIELAGSLEPEKINEAFSQVDVATMGHGRVKFIPEWHCSPGIFFVAQWTLNEKAI